MTLKQFEMEIARFESTFIVTQEQRSEREVRWEEYFSKLRSFSMEEFRIAKDELQTTQKFLPALAEIYMACLEARQSKRPLVVRRRRIDPTPHVCASLAAPNSVALQALATLSAYEAKHIVCLGKLPARCPSCGVSHLDTSVISTLLTRYPHLTEGWNPHWKGLMLCAKCEGNRG